MRNPTHSTSAPTHSLCKSSIQCIHYHTHTHSHTLSEPRALSVFHSSRWRQLTLSSPPLPSSSSSLLHAGIAYFVFVFPPRCLFGRSSSGWYQQRATCLLTSAILRTGAESLEDTRITTERGARGVLLLEATVRFKKKKQKTRNKTKKHPRWRAAVPQRLHLTRVTLSFDGFYGTGAWKD